METLQLDWFYYTPTEDDDPTVHLTATLAGDVVYSATRFTPEECYTELLKELGYLVEESHNWEGNNEDSD